MKKIIALLAAVTFIGISAYASEAAAPAAPVEEAAQEVAADADANATKAEEAAPTEEAAPAEAK